MILELNNINTFYGQAHVLWGLSLRVNEGSIVALLGRNGMGKTTTMHSIMGVTPPMSGSIRYKGMNIESSEAFKIARMGLSLVPQGRGIFPSLTVKENLTLAARKRDREDPWTLDRIYSMFPILDIRSGMFANRLSGGEQQMLAIGRALMTNPDLLLLDEPSEGLAPLIVNEIGHVIYRLKKSVSVLLAEQNFNLAMGLADYVYVISKGKVVFESTPQNLSDNQEVLDMHLGVKRGKKVKR